MAENIIIQLEDIYQNITENDVKKAKKYVLKREEAARGLSSLINELLQDAAEKVTLTAYRYGINPQEFLISEKYNKKMFEEISKVLDELEEEILDLTTAYATKCEDDKEKKTNLLLWVLALGRNNNNLKKTLENRLWMFSRDLEAMIAAAKTAKMKAADAVSIIRSYLHTAYQMPGMAAAFKNANLYKSTYIRSKGVKYGNQGSSNSEANNIERFGRVTVQMAWMHELRVQFEEEGADGYMCLRGSSFYCTPCDEVCYKVYPIDYKMPLPVHPACCCYAVPVYEKDINDLTE